MNWEWVFNILFIIAVIGWMFADYKYRKEQKTHRLLKQELKYAWQRIGDLEEQCHHRS